MVTDEFTFSAQEAQAIIRYLKSHGFYVQCYRDEHFYYDEECEASESYRQSSKMYGHAVGKLETFVDFATPKLLSVQNPERVMQMYEQIQPIFPNVTFTISKPYFLEAQPANISKGSSLRLLAQRIGLTPEHTLVFGDSLNDMTMISLDLK